MNAILKPLITWRAAVAQRSGLPPTVRHVALTLSLHMNEAGESCFPSHNTLAAETGLSRRSVLRAVQELTDTGWLRTSQRVTESGRKTSNEYAASIPQGVCDTESHTPQKGEGVCDTGSHQYVTQGHNMSSSLRKDKTPLDVTQSHIPPRSGEPKPNYPTVEQTAELVAATRSECTSTDSALSHIAELRAVAGDRSDEQAAS